MNELQRTEYLEQMGIEVFVPRFVLPAAKASVLALLPVAEKIATAEEAPVNLRCAGIATFSPASDSGVAAEPPTPRKVSGVVTDILGALGGGKSSSVDSVVKEVAAKNEPLVALGQPSEPKIASEHVEFSLSLWRVSESLLVIDTRHPKQALPTSGLLSNILFAKGLKQRLPAPEVLSWPLFDHAESRGGWSEAGEMVNAFLNARVGVQPVQYIWLMGESAYNSVAHSQSKNYTEQIGAALDMPEFSALALVLPSLTDMLLTPELKRQTWNAIRPYRVD